MAITVRAAPGELPAFWDREVVFFANLLSLFYGNQGQIDELAALVGGIDSYGGRLIPILNLLFGGGQNLLVLERRPSAPLLDYFAGELGLDVPDIEILPDSAYRAVCPDDAGSGSEAMGRIRLHPAPWVDGFVTDAQLMIVAEALGKKTVSTLEGSKKGNNKYLLHAHMAERGFSVFDTVSAASVADVRDGLARLRGEGYEKAVLKSRIGASGIGLLKLATGEVGSAAVPEYMFFEGPCLVQGWLDESVPGVRTLGSPSVQLFLDEERLNLYDVTEQILSAGSIHEGNVAPPSYLAEPVAAEMLGQAEEAGRWLHAQGYRGTASVDFLVVERTGRPEVRVCEINARVTGATYPAILARRFMPRGAWLMRNLRFRAALPGASLLQLLDRAGCLYRPRAAEGILPINFNFDEENNVVKGQFLCLARTVRGCRETLERVERILPVDWSYDRD